MVRIVGALLAFALVFAVFKMVIVALVLAGLIFRTKETVGLLFIGGVMTLLAAQPLIGFGLLALVAVAAFVNNGRKGEEADPPALTDDSQPGPG